MEIIQKLISYSENGSEQEICAEPMFANAVCLDAVSG